MIRVTRAELLKAIGDRVMGNPASAFTRLLRGGSEWYVYERPQEGMPPYPCAVLSIVSDVDGGAIRLPVSDIEWQVSCFAAYAAEASALADACIELFENEQIMLGPDCGATCVYGLSLGPLRAADDEPWMTAVTFSCLV